MVDLDSGPDYGLNVESNYSLHLGFTYSLDIAAAGIKHVSPLPCSALLTPRRH